jgi:hypothetical protein
VHQHHLARRVTAALATTGLALATALAVATPASAAHDGATIHPGVQTYTSGAQCTANFVFRDGADVLIGQAAHCSGTGGSTETNGCDSGSLPLGTQVEVDGATRPGTMVYNSWLTMQAVGETDPNTCQYNDFALIRLDPADHGRVSPDIPVLGGPTGIDRDGTVAGESVYSYGNSSLRLGLSQLSPKEGVSLGSTAGGWNHPVYTVTPGVPGDSGSAFVDAEGRAIGVLSTLAIAPLAGSNGVSDLGRALDYANSRGGMSASLVTGSTPFSGSGAVVRGLLG